MAYILCIFVQTSHPISACNISNMTKTRTNSSNMTSLSTRIATRLELLTGLELLTIHILLRELITSSQNYVCTKHL